MLVADTIVFIPHQLYSRFCDIGRSLASVTLSVCLCSKRKMARVINIKFGSYIARGTPSACTQVVRSKDQL